jgi:hypothetical protein
MRQRSILLEQIATPVSRVVVTSSIRRSGSFAVVNGLIVIAHASKTRPQNLMPTHF